MIRRPRARSIALLAWLVLLAAGCGAELSNADFDADVEFLNAVPRLPSLRMAGPVDDGAVTRAQTLEQALQAPAAELYLATRSVQLLVDHGVLGHLRTVQRLVDSPPVQRDATSRVWGPHHHPLDPFDSRFVMSRTEAAHFVFALELSPSGEAAEWQPVVTGEWSSAGVGGRGEGALTFDLDGLRRLGAGSGRGLVQVEHGMDEAGARRVDVQLVDFGESGDATGSDVSISFVRDSTGAGDLEWAVWEGEQLAEVCSRFTADGAGRSDLRLSWPEQRSEVLLLSECWDETFASTYRQYTPSAAPEWGDEASCSFVELLLPERVSAPPAATL